MRIRAARTALRCTDLSEGHEDVVQAQEGYEDQGCPDSLACARGCVIGGVGEVGGSQLRHQHTHDVGLREGSINERKKHVS